MSLAESMTLRDFEKDHIEPSSIGLERGVAGRPATEQPTGRMRTKSRG